MKDSNKYKNDLDNNSEVYNAAFDAFDAAFDAFDAAYAAFDAAFDASHAKLEITRDALVARDARNARDAVSRHAYDSKLNKKDK